MKTLRRQLARLFDVLLAFYLFPAVEVLKEAIETYESPDESTVSDPCSTGKQADITPTPRNQSPSSMSRGRSRQRSTPCPADFSHGLTHRR